MFLRIVDNHPRQKIGVVSEDHNLNYTHLVTPYINTQKKLVKCYIWSMVLDGAETWTLRAADQKHLESFEMWCWRRMEISWTDHVRNEEVVLKSQ